MAKICIMESSLMNSTREIKTSKTIKRHLEVDREIVSVTSAKKFKISKSVTRCLKSGRFGKMRGHSTVTTHESFVSVTKTITEKRSYTTDVGCTTKVKLKTPPSILVSFRHRTTFHMWKNAYSHQKISCVKYPNIEIWFNDYSVSNPSPLYI